MQFRLNESNALENVEQNRMQQNVVNPSPDKMIEFTQY